MKSKTYLTYLNDNYFYEIGYIEKHKSILTDLGYEIKKKELSNISE